MKIEFKSVDDYFGKQIYVALCVASMASACLGGEQPDFNQEVLPLLSDKCFLCHGPDEHSRTGGVRLDQRDQAVEWGALLPGKPAESEMFRRIIADDPSIRMPPHSANSKLTSAQIETIRSWIESGAAYEKHWAFQRLEGAEVPDAQGHWRVWPANQIDQFVLARMLHVGLEPAKPASREDLARRVALDLTGLPPTIQQLETYLNDISDDAYEQYVDRLLESPHYGEHLARDWLDLARYADTQGYQRDEYRSVWPWRDWVIAAFNQNLPYDEFVKLQLAGDLLEDATPESTLATAFCRLHPQNAEDGIVDEEFRSEYVADRTQTFGTAFLGLTIGCARCHDHKYDPISQHEFYQLYSFFNNIDEAGQVSWDAKDMPAPTLLLPTTEQQSKLLLLRERIAEVEAEIEAYREKPRPQLQEWLHGLREHGLPKLEDWPRFAHRFNPRDLVAAQQQDDRPDVVWTDSTSGHPASNPPRVFYERRRAAVELNGDDAIWFNKLGRWRRSEPFTVGAWVWVPTKTKSAVLLHDNIGTQIYRLKGYQLSIEEGHLDFRVAHDFPYGSIHLVSTRNIPREQWTHVTIVYDGSSKADGIVLYVNGIPLETEVMRDNLYKDIIFSESSIKADRRLESQHLKIGARLRGAGMQGGRIGEVVVFNRALAPLEVRHVSGASSLPESLEAVQDAPSAEELLNVFLAYDPAYQRLQQDLTAMRTEEAIWEESILEVSVMAEMPQPRATYMLDRGAYDAPTERVLPGTPSAILPLAEALPRNRLGLAEWLFLHRNPLTARVAINRYWQLIFGRGIVSTPNDLGLQGSRPTHPDLLDWLADDFRTDWNVRRAIKQMVMSSTYKQCSNGSGNSHFRDPSNVYLSRASTRRLTAEQVRDNVLSASGLLVSKVGGPSVKPYQPDGLWSINSQSGPYVQDHGDNLYRRSLYTFWKQTNPPPSATLFDAPSRSYCVVHRETTTTPLQSLVLWNDPQFVEAARVLAQRCMTTRADDPSQQIKLAYRRTTSRRPVESELRVLLEYYQHQLNYFESHPGRAIKLLSIGEYPVPSSLDASELAATSMVCSLLLNLSESTTSCPSSEND